MGQGFGEVKTETEDDRCEDEEEGEEEEEAHLRHSAHDLVVKLLKLFD